MGSSKTPDVVHPGEAAQAAMGTADAGEMMSVANQPVDQYGNLVNTISLGPAAMQAQQTLAGRAAKRVPSSRWISKAPSILRLTPKDKCG